jgi:hypothetical protein
MQCKYIEIGGKVNGVFKRNILIESSKKEETLKKYDFTDTYSTVYSYDNKNQDLANIVAPLYIDLDINDLEKDYDKLRKDVLLLIRKLKTVFHLQEDNIQIFFSGSKGYHIIIPYEVFGIEPSKDLNDRYKLIVTELKSYTITKSIDTRIYDSKRLFREPNTINTKTGLYKVYMTIDQVRDFSYNDLINRARTPQATVEPNKEYNPKADEALNAMVSELKERQKKTINHKVARQMLQNKELLPCVKYILQNGAQKGGRNNTAMALASALFQRNEDRAYVEQIMDTWNRTKLDEPLPERELELTVRSAFNNVNDGRRYGCGAFIDMGICVKGCPIRRK